MAQELNINPKPQSFRMKQIDELILRSLSEIIKKWVDMPDGVFFTITKVFTTRDLALAKVFYVCTPEEKHALVANTIKKNKKIINEKLDDDVLLRKMPKLKFILDRKELEAYKIDNLLSSLK